MLNLSVQTGYTNVSFPLPTNSTPFASLEISRESLNDQFPLVRSLAHFILFRSITLVRGERQRTDSRSNRTRTARRVQRSQDLS